MICTLQIHYDYDETEGILPSGLPAGKAYCASSCPNLDYVLASGEEVPFCNLFQTTVQKVEIGNPGRVAYEPSHACRHHEMQGR